MTGIFRYPMANTRLFGQNSNIQFQGNDRHPAKQARTTSSSMPPPSNSYPQQAYSTPPLNRVQQHLTFPQPNIDLNSEAAWNNYHIKADSNWFRNKAFYRANIERITHS